MLKKVLISLSFVLLFTVSNVFANEVDKLVGTYSAHYYGEQSDRYRIEKHGSKFWLFESKAKTTASTDWGRIHENGSVKVVDKKQFEKMMKKSIAGPAFGLNFNNRVIIFKVKKGFTIGRFKTATGYFVFFDGIFMDLKKEQ